jgi:hypothetical protein
MLSRKAGRPTRWINSPMRSQFSPYSSQNSQMRRTSSLMVSSSSASITNGTSTLESNAPLMMGFGADENRGTGFEAGAERLGHYHDTVHAADALAIVDGKRAGVVCHAAREAAVHQTQSLGHAEHLILNL